MIAQGIIDSSYVKKQEEDYKSKLEQNLQVSRTEETTVVTPFMEDEWLGYQRVDEKDMHPELNTAVDLEVLTAVAKTITNVPPDKKFLRKIERLIADRNKMFFETDRLDWAMGELLAYGTLLYENYNVRLSGQDVERGTFSHRHAVLKAESSEEEVILLNLIAPENQGKFNVFNSFLSEYGILGFDYGYAMASPNCLTIWEAQFGDFSNGAQIMIDQYISAAEDKWKTQNGIVMLLPHGYEGQGAEHSSARMERYLQLCAKDNMFVANCTTPANFFHLLRRQMKGNFRKPLIVFTPKSLLRHPRAVSKVEDLTNGSFQRLIPDDQAKAELVKTLVFCSGKFYYDLIDARVNKDRMDVAIVRLEQLFPLPHEEIKAQIDHYPNLEDVVWAQEEPRNMGAWGYLLLHLPEAQQMRPATRRYYGSPAAGSAVRFKNRHQQVIDYVFDPVLDNFIRKKSKSS